MAQLGLEVGRGYIMTFGVDDWKILGDLSGYIVLEVRMYVLEGYC